MKDSEKQGVRHLINEGIHYGSYNNGSRKRDLNSMHLSTIKREGAKSTLSRAEKRQFKKKWKT